MNATLLFQLWGTGTAQPSVRAQLMHEAACEGTDMRVAHTASLGERVHALLGWRERVFGTTMACIADCPKCNERVEFDLRRTDLAPAPEYRVPRELHVKAASYSVKLRAPSATDVDAAAGDPEELLTRCVVQARMKKQPVDAHQLPAEVRERIEEALRKADPLLDVQLEVTCPACAHAWSAPFDVVAYCWSEVSAWGEGMLGSIHRFASAYGWNESEVLALSAHRRDRYLQLIAP